MKIDDLKKYQAVLSDLKEKIRQARQQAASIVNTQLLRLYWEIGNTILQQQQAEGWGTKIIDRLAADFKLEFPDFKGLSIRNLKYMRAFAEAYPQFLIVQPMVAQLESKTMQPAQFVQSLVAQIPWTHHIVILNKVRLPEQRLFYIQQTFENGWSKNVLIVQIENNLYERKGKALNNFKETLPASQSDLARETLKNPYVFDFLSYNETIQERELENALIQQH